MKHDHFYKDFMRALPCFVGKIIFHFFVSLYTEILCAFEFLKDSCHCQIAANTKQNAINALTLKSSKYYYLALLIIVSFSLNQ